MLGGIEAAEIVRVDPVLDPAEIVEGLKEQVIPETELQDSEIWLLNPPTAAAVIFS